MLGSWARVFVGVRAPALGLSVRVSALDPGVECSGFRQRMPYEALIPKVSLLALQLGTEDPS